MALSDDFIADTGSKTGSLASQFAQDAVLVKPIAKPGTHDWLDQVRDFAGAAGHHVMNLPHGAAQLVENAASGVANSVAPSSAFTRKLTDIVDADNRAMTQREADYQKSTPNSAGAYAGAAAGELAPFLLGGAGMLQGAGDAVAGMLPKAPALLQRGISGATQGGIVGAAQPDTGPSYWQQKAKDVGGGVVLGGSVPGVGAALGGVKNAVLPLVSPKSVVSPAVAKLVGSDPALIEALKNPQQIVPGSMPTTAQILATPEAVATEKALANSSPDFKNRLLARSNANNDARIAAVQGVAQTPQAIEDALQARSEATRPLIDSLLTNGKPVDAAPVLAKLQSLQDSSLGTDPVVKKGVADLIKNINEGVATTGEGGTLIRPDLLDGHRQNVRNVLQQYASNGAVGTKQEAAFEPVRGAIVDAIESANPGYSDYLATYAQKSRPVNTMEAAGGILDNVGGDSRSLNSAGVPQVTLSRYSSALARALKGQNIDPEAQKTLEAVQADLQRETISNSIRAPGSDTAYNLQAPGWLAGQLYGDNFSGSSGAAKLGGALLGGAGGWLTGGGFGAAGGATAGAAAMNKVAQFGQSRVNDMLARALTDPEFAAQLAAQAQNQTPGALSAIPQAKLLGF